MNTSMINKLMQLIPSFKGTFPCDLLPETKSNMSFISNTETSMESGEHWVAVYITEHNFYFFDSFGRSIEDFEDPFKTYMKEASKHFNVYTSSQNLQSIFSDVCGLWCIYYLWSKFSSYKFMFRHFSNDTKSNDQILQDLMYFINVILPKYFAKQFKFNNKQIRNLVEMKEKLRFKRFSGIY